MPKDVRMTDLTLAVWYMDDGRGRNLNPVTRPLTFKKVHPHTRVLPKHGAYAVLAICGFTKQDGDLLVRKLAEVGIKAFVKPRKSGYLNLVIERESASDFFRRIGRFIPPPMRYKLPPDAPPFDPDSWNLGQADIGWDTATVTPALDAKNDRVYCIDVAGPQNFVTKNGVVHNCAPWSTAGPSTTQGPDAWKSDPRLCCWEQCFSLLRAVEPKVLAVESVTQAYSKGRPMIDDYTREAVEMGYSVTHVLLDAKWAGVPQSRRRFFFICHRPNIIIRPEFSFKDPPTVGQVLSKVRNPGPVAERKKNSPWRKMYERCVKKTPQGGKLRDTFDELNPEQKRGETGKVMGRPGFLVCRLHPERQMGAFIGDVFIHPTEDRLLGTSEMRALCGYPQDFKLAGGTNQHAALLARAVLPPVGNWLAGYVSQAILSAKTDGPDPSVNRIDLREPGGDWEDLTSFYDGSEDEEAPDDDEEFTYDSEEAEEYA